MSSEWAVTADVRAAVRQLRRRPWYVIGTTLSLAIGISLATAVYSVVHSILNRPIGIVDADRVGVFSQVHGTRGITLGTGNARIYTALRDRASAFSHVGTAVWRLAEFGKFGEVQRVGGTAVTRSMFDLEGLRPILGRGFLPEDEGQDVVILGHAIWASRFGSDTGIVGREIEMASDGRERFRVLGVLPPSAEIGRTASLWFLLQDADITKATNARDGGDGMYLGITVRLKPGVTFAQANAQVRAIYLSLYRNDPIRSFRTGDITPVRESTLRWIREQLELWTAAAILVLLLCAVNFATMSLSRGMRRRGELAVRAAMGASRAHIVRALMTEAMLLALLGGAVAALIAWWLVSFSSVWFSSGQLTVAPVMDMSVVAFAIVAAIVVGFIFAAAPALELAKVDLRGVLQGDASVSTTRRGESFGRQALVALQLCLALTAVACITALAQADRRYRNFAANYDYEPIVFAYVGPRTTRVAFDVAPVMDFVRSQPGVERVGALGGAYNAIVWDQSNEIVDVPRTYTMKVSPGLFDVLGVRPVAGRMPTEDEVRAGGTVLVSESFARQLTGSAERAAGLRLRMKLGYAVRDWATIVGVVPDLGGGSMGLGSSVYQVEDPKAWYFARLAVRVRGDVNVRARELALTLPRVDSRLTAYGVRSAKVALEEAQASTRGRNIFLSVATALALLLAVIGVYGLTSYSTEMRLREFGIRIALGASSPRLTRLILNDLWWMALIGIVVGYFAAEELTRFLDRLYRPLLMTRPLVTLPIVPTLVSSATLVVIAILGTAVPLRRVLRLDVMRTVQGST